MGIKKIIVIDEKIEKDLLMLCDIALKFAGTHMATVVANIANAIQDDRSFQDNDFDGDYW